MVERKRLLKNVLDRVHSVDARGEVYLFGSRARGNARRDSDWDILILLDRPLLTSAGENAIMDRIYDVEMETGEVISPLIYPKSEWVSRYSATPLFAEVERDGVPVS